MRPRSTIFAVGVAMAVGAVVFVLLGSLRQWGKQGVNVGVRQAEACTAADAQCLPPLRFVDAAGRVYSPEDYRGKVVVVNFWATWCRPCQVEIPALVAAYQRFADQGLALFGVVSEEIDQATLERFVAKHEMSYPVIWPDADLFEAFQYPANLPTTFVYDRGGKQRLRHTGILEASQLEALLVPLLAEKAPGAVVP